MGLAQPSRRNEPRHGRLVVAPLPPAAPACRGRECLIQFLFRALPDPNAVLAAGPRLELRGPVSLIICGANLDRVAIPDVDALHGSEAVIPQEVVRLGGLVRVQLDLRGTVPAP